LLSYILYGLLLLDCIVLIVVVLLQPGKADAGALFTSSVSSTAFGPRGTQTILSKITIGAAIIFMLLALMLSMNIGAQRSYMEGDTGDAPATETTLPQDQPQGETVPPATTGQEGGASNPAATDANAGGAANPNTAASPAAPAASPQGQQSPAR
jgi:preprotein translocase subunit SecG